jgi:hypothetical protein
LTKTACTVPETPFANMKPGETGVEMVPISKMPPRSFITNVKAGDTLHVGKSAPLRGIAFGGDTGVARVDLSSDGGKTWQATQLGADGGKYGFRQWQTQFTPSAAGNYMLMVRCTNADGIAQPSQPNWNPAGFVRNVIEATSVTAA